MALDPLKNAHLVAQKREQERLRERWFGSDYGLLAFAWEAVKTKDEHDYSLKPLPREKYLEDHLRNFLREPVYFILKSRQILITWTTFIGLVWECLRYQYCTVALVPKKDEDGEAHIEDRIRNVIWPSLPEWLRADFEPAQTKGKFHLAARRNIGRWDSWIVSFAKGEDQLRQYTHSRIFWDEMAYQELARKSWKAAIPTIGSRGGKGGKVICNSTFGENSFHDTLMGDPALVDKAVAVALMEQEPDLEVSRPMVGVAHYRNPKYGAFCAVYSFLADTAKRGVEWEKTEAIKFGGVDSPDWLTDYRMRRGANKGIVVYPHFDVRWNEVDPRPVNKECEIFLSVDPGGTAPTAILFWEWDARRRVLTAFDELYAPGVQVSVVGFKMQIAARLCYHLNLAPDEMMFDERLGDNVYDPEDPGGMVEYAQEPNPLVFRGNPPTEKGSGWKINNRRIGEYRLDSALRPGFICHEQRQFPADGEMDGTCQVSVEQPDGSWAICGKKHRAEPMVVFMRGRCPNVIRQLPKQVRVSMVDPELETPEKSKKIEDHAVDAARYAVMRYPNFFAVDKENEPLPAYLTKPVDRLSGQEAFWRSYHETFERNKTMQEEQVGQIGYDDEDSEDTNTFEADEEPQWIY